MGTQSSIPIVLAISGLDPSGGAGIQADIEAIASMGCHAAPVVTALTVQNTREALYYTAVDPALMRRQIEALFADMPISACKIGMLGSPAVARVVHDTLRDRPEIPIVLDPVLIAGGGGALADAPTRQAIIELLVPLATVVTPNHDEAMALAPGAKTPEDCARELVRHGAEFVLVTGADRDTEQVINLLHGEADLHQTFTWERLPGSYHGSGCTLAAALAGLIASGAEPVAAIREAQEYTWEALRQAYRIGAGQWIPNRLFWALSDKDAGC